MSIPNPALIDFIQRQDPLHDRDRAVRQAEQVRHNTKDIDVEKIRAEIAESYVGDEIPDWLCRWFASEIIESMERQLEDCIADLFDSSLPPRHVIDIGHIEARAIELVAAYMEHVRPADEAVTV